jgi:hypothetical protein
MRRVKHVAAMVSEASADQSGQKSGDAVGSTLLFFHIGKTGGTSLTRYFQSLAPRSYVQPDPGDVSRLDTSEATEQPEFISGHYAVQQWLRRVPPSWRTMLVMRNPVQHLLSSYWHLRTHGIATDDIPLRDLIEATKRLDLGALLSERFGETFEAHFDNPQARFILGKESGPLDASDRAQAAELLESLTYVGCTERLDAFAAQVAAALPWAAGWQLQALPRLMVNPYNSVDTDQIPRALLRHILAASAVDADLHQQAQRLQAERFASSAKLPVAAGISEADPPPAVRAIPVADLIRVSNTIVQGVRPGGLQIDGDQLLLHPPEGGQGCATVAVDELALDRHSQVAGRLVLAHEGAKPVIFGIEIVCDAAVLVSASFKIASGQPLDIRLRFAPTIGPARLTLRTEMAAAGASNGFAWAKFVAVEIR